MSSESSGFFRSTDLRPGGNQAESLLLWWWTCVILIHFDSFCNEETMEDDGFTMGFTGVLLTASIRIELYTFW